MSSPVTPPVLYLSGPPFGVELFRHVRARVGHGDIVDACALGRSWQEAGASVAERLSQRPTVLVAHGLAVPAAIAAALAAPPVALVLSNGPILRTRAPMRALARAASASPWFLHPVIYLRWLASSAGLRRAVVNPYVMDRDTVALLCGAGVASPQARSAQAAYLASLTMLPEARALTCPTVLVWGADDALHPASEADFLASANPLARVETIEGGRFGHPEERPWALADIVTRVLVDTIGGHGPPMVQRSGPQSATPKS
jgi:pimeloyl-ACP methyl ester carboxylesterase